MGSDRAALAVGSIAAIVIVALLLLWMGYAAARGARTEGSFLDLSVGAASVVGLCVACSTLLYAVATLAEKAGIIAIPWDNPFVGPMVLVVPPILLGVGVSILMRAAGYALASWRGYRGSYYAASFRRLGFVLACSGICWFILVAGMLGLPTK